jgi:hypothetical protein
MITKALHVTLSTDGATFKATFKSVETAGEENGPTQQESSTVKGEWAITGSAVDAAKSALDTWAKAVQDTKPVGDLFA